MLPEARLRRWSMDAVFRGVAGWFSVPWRMALLGAFWGAFASTMPIYWDGDVRLFFLFGPAGAFVGALALLWLRRRYRTRSFLELCFQTSLLAIGLGWLAIPVLSLLLPQHL
jgi:hypothetical protein